jgi:hypothetical protein
VVSVIEYDPRSLRSEVALGNTLLSPICAVSPTVEWRPGGVATLGKAFSEYGTSECPQDVGSLHLWLTSNLA